MTVDRAGRPADNEGDVSETSAKPRLAILRTGSAPDTVRAAHGDYTDMFRARCADPRIEVDVYDAVAGDLPARCDLALITGSPASVTEVEPWVDRLAEWSSAAIDRGVPQLGVCYGHQLIAYARGGAVEVNTRGYEIGSVRVALTDAGRADPLLGPLGEDLWFQAVHGDVVSKMPNDAVLLATNEIGVQAYALGDRTWCVQFHPEFSAACVSMYVDAREATIRRRAEMIGRDPDEAVRGAADSVRDTPAGPALLSRWVDLALERIG